MNMTDDKFKTLCKNAGIPESADVSRLQIEAFVIKLCASQKPMQEASDADPLQIVNLLLGLSKGCKLTCGRFVVTDDILLGVLKMFLSKMLQITFDPKNEYKKKTNFKYDIVEGLFLKPDATLFEGALLQPYTQEQLGHIKKKIEQMRDDYSIKNKNARLGFWARRLLFSLPECTNDRTDSKKYSFVGEILDSMNLVTSDLWTNSFNNDDKYNAVRQWIIAFDKENPTKIKDWMREFEKLNTPK